MAATLKYIGQAAMDGYYKGFKPNTGFFILNDFILRAAAVVADIYQKAYNDKYAELRQEKRHKDELVGVDTDLLSVQELEVKNKEAEIKHPVMSFLYDKSNVGYQFLLPITPADIKLERSSMDEIWQQDYLPKSNRIFWRPQNSKIKFHNNGSCNVQKVELYYIPAVIGKGGKVVEDAMIADGVADAAINITILKMKQVVDGEIVKMALDGNPNKTIETEINPNALNPR